MLAIATHVLMAFVEIKITAIVTRVRVTQVGQALDAMLVSEIV